MRKIVFGILIAASFVSCTVTSGLTATSNSVKSADKTGTSKASLLFGFIPLSGDASISTAAKNGNIDKIATVDVTRTNILFLFQTIETKVTGQKP